MGTKSEEQADGFGVGVGRVDYLGSPDEARHVRAVRPLGYFEANEVAGKSTKMRNAAQGVDVDADFGHVWMRACSDELDPGPHCSHVSADADLHLRRRSDSSVSADVTMFTPSCGDSSVPASRNSSMRIGPLQSCSDPDSRTSSRSPLVKGLRPFDKGGGFTPSASFARKNDSLLPSYPEDADSIIPLYSAPPAPPPSSIDRSNPLPGVVPSQGWRGEPDAGSPSNRGGTGPSLASSSFAAVDSSYLEAAWNSALPDDADPTQALL